MINLETQLTHAKFDPSISRTHIHMNTVDEGYHRSVRAELYCLMRGDYQAAGIIKYRRTPPREDGCIPCCQCGELTKWDVTYQDLCFRCIRADNE